MRLHCRVMGRAGLSRMITSSLVTILGSVIRVHNYRAKEPSILRTWPESWMGQEGRLAEGGRTGPHEESHLPLWRKSRKETMIISDEHERRQQPEAQPAWTWGTEYHDCC